MINRENTLSLFVLHLHDTDNVNFFPCDFMAEKEKNRESLKPSLILCHYNRIFHINFVSKLKLIYTDKFQRRNLYILLN